MLDLGDLLDLLPCWRFWLPAGLAGLACWLLWQWIGPPGLRWAVCTPVALAGLWAGWSWQHAER